jgi:hypothetical protein
MQVGPKEYPLISLRSSPWSVLALDFPPSAPIQELDPVDHFVLGQLTNRLVHVAIVDLDVILVITRPGLKTTLMVRIERVCRTGSR